MFENLLGKEKHMKNNYGILLIKGELDNGESPISDFSKTELGKEFIKLFDTTKIPYFDIKLPMLTIKGFVPYIIIGDSDGINVTCNNLSTSTGVLVQLTYDKANDELAIVFEEI